MRRRQDYSSYQVAAKFYNFYFIIAIVALTVSVAYIEFDIKAKEDAYVIAYETAKLQEPENEAMLGKLRISPTV